MKKLVKKACITAGKELVSKEGYKAEDIRITKSHFDLALSRISPSVNEKVKDYFVDLVKCFLIGLYRNIFFQDAQMYLRMKEQFCSKNSTV